MTIFLDCPHCRGVLTVQISERGIRCTCGKVFDRAIDRGYGRLVLIQDTRRHQPRTAAPSPRCRPLTTSR